MKKVLYLLSITSAMNSYGQWTDGNTIPDFTLDDVYGKQHNLYSQIAPDKVTLIDFFFPACSPCWDGMVEHKISDLNSQYGISGSVQLKTYGINIQGSGIGTAYGNMAVPNLNGIDITNQNLSRGDYDYNVNYPLLPQGETYGNLTNIQSAPNYVLVCPDKKAYNISYYNLESEALSYCNVTLKKAQRNLRIYVPELSTCTGLNRVNIYGHLRNTGSDNITSARVNLMVNNTILKTQNLTYTGTNNTTSTMGLTEFKFDSVLINQPLGQYGKGPYKLSVDMINGVTLTSPIEKIIKIKTFTTSTPSMSLKLELKTDANASQSSWLLYNANGDVVNQNAALSNNATTTTNINITKSGCYTVRLKDTEGDGIGGHLKINSSTNAPICNLHYGSYSYENFGYNVFYSFYVGTATSIANLQSNELINLSVYPNPTTDKFKIETPEKVTIEIIDLMGKTIRLVKEVDDTKWVDISDLDAGCYFAKVSNSDKSYKLVKIVKE